MATKTKTKTKTDEAPREHKKPWQETFATPEEIKAMLKNDYDSIYSQAYALYKNGFRYCTPHRSREGTAPALAGNGWRGWRDGVGFALPSRTAHVCGTRQLFTFYSTSPPTPPSKRNL